MKRHNPETFLIYIAGREDSLLRLSVSLEVDTLVAIIVVVNFIPRAI
jgi:hypothetical protein